MHGKVQLWFAISVAVVGFISGIGSSPYKPLYLGDIVATVFWLVVVWCAFLNLQGIWVLLLAYPALKVTSYIPIIMVQYHRGFYVNKWTSPYEEM
jgi:hypothetical protein